MERNLSEDGIEYFRKTLYEDEKKISTIHKYIRDLKKLQKFLKGRELDKKALIQYKEYLQACGEYKIKSINSFLAAANQFCEAMGWADLRVKMIKVQEEAFCPENKELSMKEYEKLIQTAMDKGDERLAFIIQTLGSTGIRISELRYITVESLKTGMADINNKGKVRRILYPGELQSVLKEYVRENHLRGGAIFCTKSGRVVDRSNIWRALKDLCRRAGIDEAKVFPHNFRHLFAKCFYNMKKDIAKLADVLGHSNIETTRIYIKSTGKEHKRQLNMMKMVIITSLQKKKGKAHHRNLPQHNKDYVVS